MLSMAETWGGQNAWAEDQGAPVDDVRDHAQPPVDLGPLNDVATPW